MRTWSDIFISEDVKVRKPHLCSRAGPPDVESPDSFSFLRYELPLTHGDYCPSFDNLEAPLFQSNSKYLKVS